MFYLKASYHKRATFSNVPIISRKVRPRIPFGHSPDLRYDISSELKFRRNLYIKHVFLNKVYKPVFKNSSCMLISIYITCLRVIQISYT